jgi:hypothetical protein
MWSFYSIFLTSIGVTGVVSTLVFYFRKHINKKQSSPEIELTKTQQIENYCKKELEDFRRKQAAPNKNENIESELYDSKWYIENMLYPNDIEKKWKTRILIEPTLFGNVIMHYDVYKGGFVYYCDQLSSLQYPLLNAIAMKYVFRFCCFDFYMDEQFAPVSPLVNVFFPKDSSKTKTTSELFVKSKPKPKPKPNMDTPSLRQNKFIKGGLCYSFPFLSEQYKQSKSKSTSSSPSLMTYADFKNFSAKIDTNILGLGEERWNTPPPQSLQSCWSNI